MSEIGVSRVERFEELIAWQKARVLTAAVYEVTRQGGFARDFGLSGQIQRAAISIMSNIAEGFERNNPAEFHQFLSTAKASCAELRAQLYVALDAGYLAQDKFTHLLQQAEEVGNIVGGLRAAVERQRSVLHLSSSLLSTQHSALRKARRAATMTGAVAADRNQPDRAPRRRRVAAGTVDWGRRPAPLIWTSKVRACARAGR